MRARFIKIVDEPYERCDIERYSKMDIDKFFRDVIPKIARGKSEKWDLFSKRKYKAENTLNTFLFGKFHGKYFDFKRIPSEYTDYQYAKHTELGHPQCTQTSGVSVSLDIVNFMKCAASGTSDLGSNIYCDVIESSSVYSMGKINEVQIGAPFGLWEIKDYLLNNTVNYVNSNCDSSGCVNVTKWITGTGKSGRTKEAESLAVGCNLSWLTNERGDLTILSPAGKEIGEVSWKTDEDHPGDEEYGEIYAPLLKSECIEIKAIRLQTLIPHNTPKGRPRKALVQVQITFHVLRLEEEEERIARIKRDYQSMRTIAAIDYNRKCDIIEGRIPEVIPSLDAVFSDDKFPMDELVESYIVYPAEDFLTGSSFTPHELEEIWNVYMPINTFCSLKDQDVPLFADETARLYCKKQLFNYTLTHEREEIIVQHGSFFRELLRLNIYKK